jgi:tripeptide aminopeptidase
MYRYCRQYLPSAIFYLVPQDKYCFLYRVYIGCPPSVSILINFCFAGISADEEGTRWGGDKITVQIKMVGDRPAGSQSTDSPVVQAMWASTQAIGQKPALFGAMSTDANLPLSLGIPAIAVGGGGKDDNNHAPNEWFDPTNAYLGPQRIFLTILGLVGVDGVSEPMLSRKK